MTKKIKVVTIIGARPQFIKAAVLSREFEKYNNIQEIIVHTGQHYDENMNRIFFDEMKIPKPKYNLGITSERHGHMTGKMIEKIEEILIEHDPNYVLVYGDTNSTLAGALAASKLHIPIVHVEAGLRSFNMKMPEEQNRILTDHISTYLFCPNENAISNLKDEGLVDSKMYEDGKVLRVINSGDLMYEGIIFYRDIALNKSKIIEDLNIDKTFYLATIHRPENTNHENKLREIFTFFSRLETEIILPLHPRTKKYLELYNIDVTENIKIIEPVGYLDMIMLLDNAEMVFTDSGGLQKEAYWLKTRCVTLRDQTEWIETVKSGWNVLFENYNGSHEIKDNFIDMERNVSKIITDIMIREL